MTAGPRRGLAGLIAGAAKALETNEAVAERPQSAPVIPLSSHFVRRRYSSCDIATSVAFSLRLQPHQPLVSSSSSSDINDHGSSF